MNALTIISGGFILLIGWTWFGAWLGERYDFFSLPFILGLPLVILFIISFFMN